MLRLIDSMSDKTKLNNIIEDFLDELFPKHKFKLSFREFYPEHFGNEIIEYEFENFSLFVTKDRSQLFLDLASRDAPGKHIGLLEVLETIGAAQAADFTEYDISSVKRQLELLSRNLLEILANLDRISQIK
jgi:hypothetical protein